MEMVRQMNLPNFDVDDPYETGKEAQRLSLGWEQEWHGSRQTRRLQKRRLSRPLTRLYRLDPTHQEQMTALSRTHPKTK